MSRSAGICINISDVNDSDVINTAMKAIRLRRVSMAAGRSGWPEVYTMRTILWLIRTVFYLLGAKGDGRRAMRLRDSGDLTTFRHLRDSRVRHWALAMLRYAGVTVKVRGEENIPSGTALYLPNHQSDWDIPIMIAYGPSAGLLSKDSIGKIPLIRTWMDFMECVYIDRSNPRESIRSLREVDKRLKSGRSMVVFPEGTRSKGEEIGPFHNGSFRGAVRAGIPIVPVSIDGSYKIMEANSGKWIRPGHVILTFLPAIDTASLDKEQQKNLGDTIIAQIYAAREEGRHPAPAENQPAADDEAES